MSGPKRKKKQRSMIGIVAPLVVLAVIFVVLEFIARTTGISEYILPVPSKIVSHTLPNSLLISGPISG